MAGPLWCGRSSGLTSAALYAHENFSLSPPPATVVVAGTSQSPLGITSDGLYTYWCGSDTGRIYKYQGSTPIDSFAFPFSYTALTCVSWDGVNLLVSWTDGILGKVTKFAGFSSTEIATLTLSSSGITGVSSDGIDTLTSHIIDASNSELRKFTQFSTTLQSTISLSIENVNDVSWDGNNVMFCSSPTAGDAIIHRYKSFTGSALDSLVVQSIGDIISGLEHGSLTERLGSQPVAGTYWCGVGIATTLYKSRGFSSSIEASTNIESTVGEATDMARDHSGNTLVSGRGNASNDVLYKFSGMSSTLLSSFNVNAIDAEPSGITWDGTDCYMAGTIADRVTKLTGFTSAVQSFIDLSGLDGSIQGISFNRGDLLVAGKSTGKLYRMVGFSTTVREYCAVDLGLPDGISFNGADALWIKNQEAYLVRQSGFSTTRAQTVYVGDVNGSPVGLEHGDYSQRRQAGEDVPRVQFPRVAYAQTIELPSYSYRRPHPPLLGPPPPTPVAGHTVTVRRRVSVTRFEDIESYAIRRRATRFAGIVPPQVAGSPATTRRRTSIAPEVVIESKGTRSGPRLLIDAGSRRYVTARGLYRVFRDAEYRIYHSTSGPPVEGGAYTEYPTLPVVLAFGGIAKHYFSVSYFNGVIDSGFLPLGPRGETYILLDIQAGVLIPNKPHAPDDFRLEQRAGGVVRIHGLYIESGSLRATEWAITYTTNGAEPGTPPAVSPTVTRTMPTSGLAILAYDLPAQANGTTVKVRLQARRNDSGTWVYSDNSTVLTLVVDTVGPTAPVDGQRWAGRQPEDL